MVAERSVPGTRERVRVIRGQALFCEPDRRELGYWLPGQADLR